MLITVTDIEYGRVSHLNLRLVAAIQQGVNLTEGGIGGTKMCFVATGNWHVSLANGQTVMVSKADADNVVSAMLDMEGREQKT